MRAAARPPAVVVIVGSPARPNARNDLLQP
jgi:hypothetical protein